MGAGTLGGFSTIGEDVGGPGLIAGRGGGAGSAFGLTGAGKLGGNDGLAEEDCFRGGP